jgi:hypothetical protein
MHLMLTHLNFLRTDEELSLYMNLKYKPSIEIAEEIAIDTVFEMNDFSTVRKMVD